jgi:cbb3-type cytochrome oxidase maturation protein
MSVIFLLIPISVVIAAGFLFAFIWAVRAGQYEDTYTPSLRLLLDDPPQPGTPQSKTGRPPGGAVGNQAHEHQEK